MSFLRMGDPLLGDGLVSDDNIVHFNPWRDFNDAVALEELYLEPDPAQIAAFVDVVFSYCDGLIPVRSFIDKGQGIDGRPNNIWINADAAAPDKMMTFAHWAGREGAAVYVIPGTVAEQGQAKSADIAAMQAIVVDIDTGDIGAKLTYLTDHLGDPTLVVESGGRTPEGAHKLHVWWKLSEPATGADVEQVCALRGMIAAKVAGDTHFRSAHQPIRVPGTIYHKGGSQRMVQILRHVPKREVDLADFAEMVSAMSLMPGIGAAAAPAADKPALADVLTTPVHEGGADAWSRFEGASAAIGHYIRQVHDGRISPDEGWEAMCQYNAAMLRPSWPIDRLKAESDRLWRLHVERNGPPLVRLDSAEPAPNEIPAFTLGSLLDDTSPMPADIIAPRVLTPGGLLVLGGAPKVGKSDLLISWLVHMAAGQPFLGFTPPRSLRIFYLQAEIQYHYLRERIQQIALPTELLAAARDNLIATPKLKMLLDAEGSMRVAEAIRRAFPTDPVDIICIDPIRNLFDGGPDGGGENDNAAMMFFLKDRVEVLRDHINPDCGVILVHHTKKLSKQQVKDDPFLALSGASALRGFYTSGLILHRPDEESPQRRLEIELRNGPALQPKLVDKIRGEWVELNPMNERLVRKDVGAKLDAERVRKHDVILGMLLDEAAEGRLYTVTQFTEKFENKGGLGGKFTIRDRISVLATKGYVKFLRDGAPFGYPAVRSRYGYLCVEGMEFAAAGTVDEETGEVFDEPRQVLPSHYKCPHSGVCLDVENPAVWVYPEGGESALGPQD
ncbi:MAG: AAA family ATPase [Brevundimonas sp.]|uniref:AAA family ATPase n=1 Tax=Brevundimonas sp. TaxID=1871086 RepID=UPI00391D373E